jgi:hypothetical protein
MDSSEMGRVAKGEESVAPQSPRGSIGRVAPVDQG